VNVIYDPHPTMFHRPLSIIICASLILLSGCGMSASKEKISLEQQLTEKPKYTKTIIAFGDSITAGYGLNSEESYPAQLQTKLIAEGYSEWEVINNGISGDTTAGGLSRVEWVLGQNPDIVILTLGGNDALRGIDPKSSYENLEQTIEAIQIQGSKVILGGMQAPRNLGKQYVDEFGEMYPRLADKYNLPLIPFVLNGIAGDPDLNLPDGIHPTKEGYSIMTSNVWDVLASNL
jgi:acyl-CoA thioesterase-1